MMQTWGATPCPQVSRCIFLAFPCPLRCVNVPNISVYTGCSFCGLIRRPEHLIGRHWYHPVNWRSFIRCSPGQWVSQCYDIEYDRSCYCALFCIFIDSCETTSNQPARWTHGRSKYPDVRVCVFDVRLKFCVIYWAFTLLRLGATLRGHM
jgi:hypothetical protein